MTGLRPCYIPSLPRVTDNSERNSFLKYRKTGIKARGCCCWDGFQRINTQTFSGGIVGIFRHNSPESQRTVTVKFLDPDAMYAVTIAPGGENIIRATGKDLEKKGFPVRFNDYYDGSLFEISRIP